MKIGMMMRKLETNQIRIQEFSLESIIEGIIYLLSEPITLKKLSLITTSDIKQIEDVLGTLQAKYEQKSDPFFIEYSSHENLHQRTVELKLRKDALQKLQSYSFISSQELPTKYFRIMSVIMNLEYVKNEKIDQTTLKKELKLEKNDLNKFLGVLFHFGYLERDKDYFRTSNRFLRRMGFPTDKKLVREMLKEKTIEFALQYFGFENDR